jgi:O-acetylhomoserine (thiol)-lyase
MDGHGACVGGAIVDGGKFDWMAHKEKFPGLCTPDESYHGITYAEKFGRGGAFITKCTAQLMRDFGSIQRPQHLSIEPAWKACMSHGRHCENGQRWRSFCRSIPSLRVSTAPAGDKSYERRRTICGRLLRV